MNNFYKLDRDVIRLDQIDIITKRERYIGPDKNGKDDWAPTNGEFLIVINDDREYSYSSMQDRDIVYNDLISKLTMPDTLDNVQGQVFTDKQALSVTY